MNGKLSLALLSFVIAASAQFSATEKQEIVQEHNNLRSSIAKGTYVAKGKTMPPAANMKKMYWNNTLEESAQSVVNTCLFEHSTALHNGIGENMYKMYTTNITGQGKEACQLWEGEFDFHGWSHLLHDGALWNEGAIGHATQMAWANSGQIGCGAAVCDENEYKIVFVCCHYWAQGNMMDRYVYNEGASCSECSKCDPNTKLCVPPSSC